MKSYVANHRLLVLALVVLAIATPVLLQGFWIGLAVLWGAWIVTLAATLLHDRRTA